ncbi:MAG TPA: hypothetical protein EYP03_01380 [Aquificae bacterium]|nr:hypothetical protein [Aquificota bacterium]
MFFEKRYYRKYINNKFTCFETTQGESNLFISYEGNYSLDKVKRKVDTFLLEIRTILKDIVNRHEQFLTSLTPISINDPFLPEIILKMLKASQKALVGPWAGVAGAVAFYVGEKLLKEFNFNSLFIENGGDCFLISKNEISLGIFIPNLEKILPIKLPPGKWGVSSSSSKKGHSLSFGRTNLATVIVKNDPILSDCLATYFGNSTNFEDALKKLEKMKNTYDGLLISLKDKFIFDGKIFQDIFENVKK